MDPSDGLGSRTHLVVDKSDNICSVMFVSAELGYSSAH